MLCWAWINPYPAIEISKSVNGLEIDYVDISPLPFLNTDLEVNGTYPPAVEAFRQKILAADSILFASPEYNYSMTGTKNRNFISHSISMKLIIDFCVH